MITGLVLVGGRSSRLGRDKSRLEIEGVASVTRVVRAMRPLVDEVLLVGGTPREEAHAAWIPDRVAGAGPLGGIISGLLAAKGDWCLALACDTPLVSTAVLGRLVEAIAEAPQASAIVPRLAAGPEPLMALYATRALGPLQEALERGERALHRVLERIPVHWLGEEAWRAVDPDLDAFLNVNTEADLARATRAAKLTHGRGDATL